MTTCEGHGRQVLQAYHLEDLVAESSMSHVFVARRRIDQRRVAIKVQRHGGRENATLRRLMLHEVHALEVGANPMLVELLDAGETPDGRVCLVLEWLDGPSLADVLTRQSPIPTGRALALFASLLDAIGLLHARHVVHADLKPQNVLLVRGAPEEQVRLVDLGAACVGSTRVCLADEVVGTPGYISPEVGMGELPTVRSDVYAAGLVLFELLGGCKPFDGDTVNDAVSQRSPGPVRAAARQRVTGFPCLDEVIATAAATDPRHRFGDIDHLRAAFLSAIEADRDRDQRGWAARTMGRRSTLPRAACTR